MNQGRISGGQTARKGPKRRTKTKNATSCGNVFVTHFLWASTNNQPGEKHSLLIEVSLYPIKRKINLTMEKEISLVRRIYYDVGFLYFQKKRIKNFFSSGKIFSDIFATIRG
ncbi:hypothetical protein [Cytobacillus firmus]|uniref:hypothetical protein n=1 Tax=Cytobacillus firmus TaxID=1399 RepID=UPI003002C78A